MGWWAKGKQHGLGRYLQEKEKKMKYGLWEYGKRIKWYPISFNFYLGSSQRRTNKK